jgi:hypothetical protein
MADCSCFGNNIFPAGGSGTVVIILRNASDHLSKIDSVLLIFDHVNLRGAGRVKKPFSG